MTLVSPHVTGQQFLTPAIIFPVGPRPSYVNPVRRDPLSVQRRQDVAKPVHFWCNSATELTRALHLT